MTNASGNLLNRRSQHRRVSIVILIALLMLSATSLLAQASVTLTFSDGALQVGDTATIEARLTCEPACALFALTVNYDSDVLQINSVEWGGALGSLTRGAVAVLEEEIDVVGTLSLSAIAVGDVRPTDDLLFTLEVTALANGFTTFTPVQVAFGDSEANPLFGQLAGGSIEVIDPTALTATAAAPTVAPTLDVAGLTATQFAADQVAGSTALAATAGVISAVTATPTLAPETTAEAAATAGVFVAGDCRVAALLQAAPVHVGPSSDRTVRTSLLLNAPAVIVTGQTFDEAGERWWRIQPDGVTTELDRYWVADATVEEIGNCEAVPQVEGSAIITGGIGGSSTSLVGSFTNGQPPAISHSVNLSARATWTITCTGNPTYPQFVFNGVNSNGQTTVTVPNVGPSRVPLQVFSTVRNRQGQVVNIINYSCTLSRA